MFNKDIFIILRSPNALLFPIGLIVKIKAVVLATFLIQMTQQQNAVLAFMAVSIALGILSIYAINALLAST